MFQYALDGGAGGFGGGGCAGFDLELGGQLAGPDRGLRCGPALDLVRCGLGQACARRSDRQRCSRCGPPGAGITSDEQRWVGLSSAGVAFAREMDWTEVLDGKLKFVWT